MADLKISDLPTDVTTLASGDKLPIAQASALTSNVYVTASEIQAFTANAPVFDAGSATASSKPKLQSASFLTTPEVGAIEFNDEGLYFTPSSGARTKVAVKQYCRLNATNTLANNTGSQPIIPTPTAVTITTGVYIWEMMLSLSGLSATSGNIGIFFNTSPATAVISSSSSNWHSIGIDGGTGLAATQTGTWQLNNASVLTAATGTNAQVSCKGIFTCTTGGTIVPQVSMLTAVTTGVIAINGWFSIERICAATTNTIGNWA